MKNIIFIVLVCISFSCQQNTSTEKQETTNEQEAPTKTLAKFEPEDGKCLVFAGQELTAIGGLEEYNDGYFDHFETPAGFTMYSDLCPGDTMFGYVLKGLDGIFTTDDWGDSPSNMNLQLADEDFKHCALAIGLWLVNHEGEVAQGGQDTLIDKMGDWLLGLGRRPVFLRIGYEFQGEWNHYDREDYITAYKRIKDRLDSMGVKNVAYVWQSHGWGTTQEQLESWYPGDEYVDWCGYSFFARWNEVEMIEFAKKKGKPVFIAEASPTISTPTVKTNGKTKETILSNPEQAQEAWEKWFTPFFETIQNPENNIKAFSYINCHWKANRMWFDNPTFQDVDARLQTSEDIANKWKAELADERYLHASPTLFEELWHE